MEQATALAENLRDIEISHDPEIVSQLYGIDGDQLNHIEEYFWRAHDPDEDPALEGELKALIVRYPGNPIFRNFLGTWLENTGEKLRAIGLLSETIEHFPDYVYANVSMAGHLIQNGQPEKALAYLGKDLRIGERFMPRTTFHIREVELYEVACIKYLLATNRVEKAVARTGALSSFFDNIDLLEAITIKVMTAALDEGVHLPMDLDLDNDLIDRHPRIEELQLREPSVRWLFKEDLRISAARIEYILTRPKENLVADLELVLDHGIKHFKEYLRMMNDDDLMSTDIGFMTHAFMLLGELPGRRSLQVMLGTLAQNADIHEVFFGDVFTDALWEPVAKRANEGLDLLTEFMLSPEPYDIAKMVVADAVRVHAKHQQESLPQVEQWYGHLLGLALKEESSIGRDVVNILVMQVVDLRISSLMPLIEQLHAGSRFDTSDTGTIGHLRKEMAARHEPYFAKILPIEERYADLAAFEDPKEEEWDLDQEDYFDAPPQQPIQRPDPKLGRNDPCPCGSGKKYKKCCLN